MKFKINDEVLVKTMKNERAKIWGKRYDEKRGKHQYAVGGDGWNVFCYENELSTLKEKDELELGDKFLDINNSKVEVIQKIKDEIDGVKYLGKTIFNDNLYISLWNAGEINKIIYE